VRRIVMRIASCCLHLLFVMRPSCIGRITRQGRPKAPPATQKASEKSSGDKNKEVRGTKFKIVVTRCHILRLKCTKFDFGWGSAPDPAGEAHSTSPDPLAGFKGVYF